jgi:hypothetical protein
METLPAEILVEILTFVCADIVNSLDDVNSQGEPLFATRLKAYPKLLLVSSKFHKLVEQARINGKPIRQELLLSQKIRFNHMLQAAATGDYNHGHFRSLRFCKRWCGSVWKNALLEEILPLVMLRSPYLCLDLENRFIFPAVRGLKHLIEKATPVEESGNIIPWQPMPVEGERYSWVEPFPLVEFNNPLYVSTVSFVVGKYRFKRRYSEWGPHTWVGFSVVSCTVTSTNSGSGQELPNVVSEGGEQDRYWLWLACGPGQGHYRTLKLFDYQEERVYERSRYQWEDIDHELENFRDYMDDGKSF